jgi:CrcB protein
LLNYLAVAIGGALGSVARYGLGLAIGRLTGPDFPWPTVFINIVGSFLIGLFVTVTADKGRLPLSPEMRNFLIVGLCGGFTTFSSFSLQTLDLLRVGRPGWALANVGLSVAICLGAVAAGFWMGQIIRPTPAEAAPILRSEPGAPLSVAIRDEACADRQDRTPPKPGSLGS